MVAFSKDFEIYCDDGCNEGQQFQYWYIFIQKIMSVPCDLTQYQREGDWSLHKREKSQQWKQCSYEPGLGKIL